MPGPVASCGVHCDSRVMRARLGWPGPAENTVATLKNSRLSTESRVRVNLSRARIARPRSSLAENSVRVAALLCNNLSGTWGAKHEITNIFNNRAAFVAGDRNC